MFITFKIDPLVSTEELDEINNKIQNTGFIEHNNAKKAHEL